MPIALTLVIPVNLIALAEWIGNPVSAFGAGSSSQPDSKPWLYELLAAVASLPIPVFAFFVPSLNALLWSIPPGLLLAGIWYLIANRNS